MGFPRVTGLNEATFKVSIEDCDLKNQNVIISSGVFLFHILLVARKKLDKNHWYNDNAESLRKR
jgi:hypothetical protein